MPRNYSEDCLEDLLGGLLASFAVPARMKKPLDFDVASNPHDALLETEEPAHDHRSQLSSPFSWRRCCHHRCHFAACRPGPYLSAARCPFCNGLSRRGPFV